MHYQMSPADYKCHSNRGVETAYRHHFGRKKIWAIASRCHASCEVARSGRVYCTILSPRRMPHSDHDGHLAKRQKRDLGSVPKNPTSKASSRIFAPFRVCRRSMPHVAALLRAVSCWILLVLLTASLDYWPRFSHWCPLHDRSARQDHLPDHYLRRPISPDVRPQARPEPRFRQPP